MVETTCAASEKSRAAFEKVADEQIGGIPEAARERSHAGGGQAPLPGKMRLVPPVTVRTEEQITIVEAETKGGLTRGIAMAPDGIDREFAVNGLDIAVASGFVCAALFLDARLHGVVGYAIDRSIDARLSVCWPPRESEES